MKIVKKLSSPSSSFGMQDDLKKIATALLMQH